MKKVKLIVTDLDMTALRSDKSISEYTKDIFGKCAEKNIITAIATGRYFIGAENPISVLRPDFSITTDGAMMYKYEQFFFGIGFDIVTTNRIIQEILQMGAGLELSAATATNVFINRDNIPKSHRLHKAIYNDFSAPLTECAYKIGAELSDISAANDIGKKFNCKVINYRGEKVYGFIRQDTGKAQSIHKLAEILEIQMSEILAFGDDMNDIEMLTECGHGVAVENAIPELKKVADSICESNDNDGVARYIEKYIL